ncbi:MAG: pyrimidine 5'-nucleotidase [Alphaproteobacteria bacterium]|nr:pyrimidine 5'-nucleotidase [Alphaproteobacteria bacterium]
MVYTTRREGCPLGEIETWIFDLDNTLYPASCRLFDQVAANMRRFICERMNVTPEQADTLRRQYFRDHGTTLRGLMINDGVDPHEFLSFVHEIDLACVPLDPALGVALTQLNGLKIVHTNGSVRHAERLLDHLGITSAFSGIIDIVAAEFDPKPALPGYNLLLARHGVDPKRALMVEDIARNLEPAAQLGMTTAWVPTEADWAMADSDRDYINHVVHDLAGFLADAAELQDSGGAR